MTSAVRLRQLVRQSPWAALVVVSLGYFMNIVDSAAVNVAVPSIATGLDATADQILWVLNGYLFTFAMLLLLAGRLGDLVGHRNLFFVGLGLFTAASLLCALSSSAGQLITGRVLQGVGAAAAAPQALAITTAVFPPQRRAMAFGVLASVLGSAAAAAPAIGAVLTGSFGWRSIFYLNLPIGILGMAATYVVLPATRRPGAQRLPIRASLLASLGLFAVLFALIEGARFDWGQIWGPIAVSSLLGLGLVMLIGFVLWERLNGGGLLPRATFASRNYALMVWASMGTYFGIFGTQLVMTIYLQSALGSGPLATGLVLSPMWLAASLAAPAAGRLYQRFSGRTLLITGYLCFSAGTVLAALLAHRSLPWEAFVPPLVFAGAGVGLTFGPLTVVAMNDVTPDAFGAASGLIEAVRQVAGALCIAVVGAILQTVWAASMRAQASADALRLPARDRASLRAAAERLVDRGLQPGIGGSGSGLGGSGTWHRILQQASEHGLVSAAAPALLVTAILILSAAVASAFIRTGGEAVAQAPQEADVSATG
jgi:EmrB/QacA subfamily drug resistance transporter